jgi:uncharacterized protein Yka (UPF0111/DUF47 family)
MVTPFESDEQARRKILTLCQDHARVIQEMARQLSNLVDMYLEGKGELLRESFNKLSALGREAREIQWNTVKGLVQIGPAFSSRSDVLQMAIKLTSIGDSLEGAGYRIVSLAALREVVDSQVGKALSELSLAVLQVVTELRKTLLMLSMNPYKAIENAKLVKDLEMKVDNLYRETDLKILTVEKDVGRLLLLRDITMLLENAADLAEDAVDSTQIIAMSV